MSNQSPAEMRNQLANSLLELTENFAPILDTADGFKAEMERRGWSPTAAETVALQWLTGAIERAWRS